MHVYLTTTLCALSLIGCTGGERASDTTLPDTASKAERPASATAVIRDAAGRELGTLTFTDTTGGIAVSGRLTGLTPGEHGIHVHDIGRCEPPDFKSAGTHWNPTGRQHGTQNPQGPHLGDLPNVSAGSDSSGVLQNVVTPGGALRSGAQMLLDADAAAVVIHSGPDDYRTNPSGSSGDPVACGVITGA